MEKSLLIGGFGGQGVMVSGQLLCYAAAEETEDKFVTFFPSYGAEQRGGTANCYVIISDDHIGSPMVDQTDELMIFNNPSLEKFESCVRPGGMIFVNSSVVTKDPTREDVRVLKVPATDIALELGNGRVQNLVMVGAYVGYTNLLDGEIIKRTAEKKLGRKRPEFIPLNNAAFQRGWDLGAAARAQEGKE